MAHSHSAKFLRQRKFFLWLPVFVLPAITLFFFLLGGGGARGSLLPNNTTLGGLNSELPDAHNTPHPRWTKLDFYKQADQDSARRKQLRARDPYYQLEEINSDSIHAGSLLSLGDKKTADAAASTLLRQIKQMNQQLKKPVEPKPVASVLQTTGTVPDISRLETLLNKTNQQKDPSDPEMEQLKGMLDKIYAIQHPQLFEKQQQDSLEQQAPKAYAIMRPETSVVSVIQDTSALMVSGNQFYSIGDSPASATSANTIAAVIAENQILVSGALVKLRLKEDIDINGLSIAADQLIYGVAHINGERLEVSINSIRVGQKLLPVKLSVFDLDGLPGIAIPAAIGREVVKQSAGQNMQNISLLSVDPSVGAQAASAGIQAAKTLLHKKIQLVQVRVAAGYEVLLQNDKRVH